MLLFFNVNDQLISETILYLDSRFVSFQELCFWLFNFLHNYTRVGKVLDTIPTFLLYIVSSHEDHATSHHLKHSKVGLITNSDCTNLM